MYLDILGTSGLRRTGGYVLEEFLRQLKGPKGIELLREFTWNNPQAGAIRSLIHSLVRQVKWDVEAAQEPDDVIEAQEAEELVETSMHDMAHTWHDYVAEVLSIVEYGFAPFEIIYKMRRGPGGPDMVRSKYDDGQVGWRKIELRSQDSLERWEFDPQTFDLKGFWQRDNYVSRYVYIPIDRCILFRTEKFKNNPEGRSLFRNSIIPYLRLKHIEDIEAIGVERDLTGLPTMEAPAELLSPDASPEDKAMRREVERMLAGVKNNERGYVLTPASMNAEGKPTGWKFSLQASPGQRSLDIVKIKDSYKTDILQTFLAQFLQMGVQSNAVGSFAQASSATNLFGLALGAILDNVEETINRHQVDPLLEINCYEPANFCKIRHGDVETPPLDELSRYLSALFTAGMVGPNSEKLKQKLYEFGGLPYEPAEQVPQGPVKTADQLIAEVMAGRDPHAGTSAPNQPPVGGVVPGAPGATGPGVPGVTPPGAATGEVKTADQLIQGVTTPKAPPPQGAAKDVQTADELVDKVLPKKV